MANTRNRVAVLTVSDGVAAGTRDDRSGGVASDALGRLGFEVVDQRVVPDEKERIAEAVRAFVGSGGVDWVVTTGGTGLGPRDVTPEAVRPLLDREIPGYGELLRADGLKHIETAVLSRSLAGSIGRVLVVCLPGSPSAVREGIEVLAPTVGHALALLDGQTRHGS